MGTIVLGACATASAALTTERPLAAPPPAYVLTAPPTASFDWFPSSPRVGERFTLVSTSSDFASPIVTFAWDTSDDGPFGEFHSGGASTSATFATPGSHTVRLRVVSQDHLSSTATEVIHMRPPLARVLRPFPTVVILGRPLATGVKVSVFAVKAPAKAAIKVTCRGRGCPVRSAARVAVASRGHPIPVPFRRFERVLPSGVKLEVRVSKGASIGAYTRFVVRRHRLPFRVDSCLSPSTLRPMAYPSE